MLANRTVLAAGGVKIVQGNAYPTMQAVKSALLWDLAVGEQLGYTCLSWQSAGNLQTATVDPSIVLLSNGQALVSGCETFTNDLEPSGDTVINIIVSRNLKTFHCGMVLALSLVSPAASADAALIEFSPKFSVFGYEELCRVPDYAE
jgi:hypothetical protein